MKGLFLSHRGRRCGVYQFGYRLLHTVLVTDPRVRWTYEEVATVEDVRAALNAHAPDFVLANHHPETLPAVDEFGEFPCALFLIEHEIDQQVADDLDVANADKVFCTDSDLFPRNPIVAVVPRFIPEPVQPQPAPELFTVGSFGFATPGKGFDSLCRIVNEQFDEALIRINIPPHDWPDLVTQEHVDAIVSACRAEIRKPGIRLEILSDFMDESELLQFLGRNTINAFVYHTGPGRGISSALDYALACGRPLAVNGSSMFRNVLALNPSVNMQECKLAEIAERGTSVLEPLVRRYRPRAAAAAWTDAILAAMREVQLRRSTPDGRGMNKLLDDRSRDAYAPWIEAMRGAVPEIMSRKIPRANVQQAFGLEAAERFLKERVAPRILAVGSYEDSAVATLKKRGWRIEEVDPEINRMELRDYFGLPETRPNSFDLILSISVLEHVENDTDFMRMVSDLLVPGGQAILTVDFRDSFRDGDAKPSWDHRLYTRERIRCLMRAIPECALVDRPAWDGPGEDFEYEGCRYAFASIVIEKRAPSAATRPMLLAEQADLLKRQAAREAESAAREAAREAESAAREAAREAESAAREAALSSALVAMQSSSSWRLTRPMRWLVRRASGCRVRVKSLLRRVLDVGLAACRRIPVLKRMFRLLLRIVPGLGPKLSRYAANRPEVGFDFRSALVGAAARRIRTSDRRPPIVHEAPKRRPRQVLVYVDHTVDASSNTGVQRVVRGLASGLLAAGSSITLVRWCRERACLVEISQEQAERFARWNGPATSVLGREYAPESGNPVVVPRHHEDDESWLLIPEVPHINHFGDEPTLDVMLAARSLGLRVGAVFYDAIPLKLREYAEGSAKHDRYMQALLLADLIVPISEWSAADLVTVFCHHQQAIPGNLPSIVPVLLPSQAISATPCPGEGADARERYVLCVGSIEPRKNHRTLLSAFRQFRGQVSNESWKLVLIGNLHPDLAPIVREAERAGFAQWIGNASDEVLRSWYTRCSFTVFPSVEEGFGLPILESVEHGRACICADFGSMHEVSRGGGCLTVDVRDTDALCRAITTLASDGSLRLKLEAEAVGRPRSTWADYARRFRDAMLELDHAKSVGRIWYWIDQTSVHPANTGVQRVVRGLARGLFESGRTLEPVCWDAARQDFAAVSQSRLEHLARWNGPDLTAWRAFEMASAPRAGDWLIIPEILSSPAGPSMQQVMDRARQRGLRVAWIFYDAIPVKLARLYPPQATEAHARYMEFLERADLVLAISETARHDLHSFLSIGEGRSPGLSERLVACPLPAEFPGTPRVTTPDDATPRSDSILRILCVGTVEPRKGHLALAAALETLMHDPDAPRLEVTIAGGDPYPDLARSLEERLRGLGHVRWIRDCDDALLQSLYRECDFTVYPSIEEGFGLPILESLWYAKPCICRNSGSMLELAREGGCLTVDTESVSELANAIRELASDPNRRKALAMQATARSFDRWSDYGRQVLVEMGRRTPRARRRMRVGMASDAGFRSTFPNLSRRPTLSLCISTYNRAAWLDLSLRNLDRQGLLDGRLDVEILVCDNASSDDTPRVVEPYLRRPGFRYIRNEANVGMLGNLRVTANAAAGRYVWILGDDDLVLPGAVDRVLDSIRNHPSAALVYLNYSYTRDDDPAKVVDLDEFLASGTPISAPTPDRFDTVASISTMNENFFTAIYGLVFRRDHALRAYSQDTSGRPFSSMGTCIPTTKHVLNRMMQEKAVWVGSPQVMVNMNVSWLRYAPLWILERIPEVLDLAELMGALPDRVDGFRRAQIPGIHHWLGEMLKADPLDNRAHFDLNRLACRMKYIPEFRAQISALRSALESDGGAETKAES